MENNSVAHPPARSLAGRVFRHLIWPPYSVRPFFSSPLPFLTLTFLGNLMPNLATKGLQRQPKITNGQRVVCLTWIRERERERERDSHEMKT
jgi:hypothetical protein